MKLPRAKNIQTLTNFIKNFWFNLLHEGSIIMSIWISQILFIWMCISSYFSIQVWQEPCFILNSKIWIWWNAIEEGITVWKYEVNGKLIIIIYISVFAYNDFNKIFNLSYNMYRLTILGLIRKENDMKFLTDTIKMMLSGFSLYINISVNKRYGRSQCKFIFWGNGMHQIKLIWIVKHNI